MPGSIEYNLRSSLHIHAVNGSKSCRGTNKRAVEPQMISCDRLTGHAALCCLVGEGRRLSPASYAAEDPERAQEPLHEGQRGWATRQLGRERSGKRRSLRKKVATAALVLLSLSLSVTKGWYVTSH